MTSIPTHVDHYEIKAHIGSSPTADIYRAVDPRDGRDVVVKVMKTGAGMEREAFLQFHRRQAELLRRLDHPALPEYYHYVETAERVYTVMEFVDGPDLLALLEERDAPLPEEDVIAWAVQVCDFLTWMYTRAPEPLIYRDLKPSNLILDRRGRVRIADFCLVENAGSDLALVGTEGYAPPEQYRGVSDARTDVYSLGATLHHLLTRRDPRKEEPFTFHEAPPRSLNPALSEEIETVIVKALACAPEERYQSAEEMKAALLACPCGSE